MPFKQTILFMGPVALTVAKWLSFGKDFIKHSNMPLQYISDHAGNHTAVVIPMSEWELLTHKHQDLKQLEQPKQDSSSKKPSDFAGTMPAEVAEAFSKYAANEASFTSNGSQPKLKPSQMRGFLSAASAEAMQLHTEQSRNEWNTF